MDLETAQITTTAKLPTLKQGEYDMWRLRIEQYFQIQDYALWDVIENGNSFKPVAQTTTNADGTSTGTSSQSESYTSTPSAWKSALAVTVKAPRPKSILSLQLGALDLTKSQVDCWMVGNLKQDPLLIVEKQLVLEMFVDESLEMIMDESVEMIVDEPLMVEDKSLEKLVDETLKHDE
ncbi:hypothetical protein Tco_1482823 [Tanacetum coccineum]